MGTGFSSHSVDSGGPNSGCQAGWQAPPCEPSFQPLFVFETEWQWHPWVGWRGWCMPFLPALTRQRQVGLCELEASLIYIASSRVARSTCLYLLSPGRKGMHHRPDYFYDFETILMEPSLAWNLPSSCFSLSVCAPPYLASFHFNICLLFAV